MKLKDRTVLVTGAGRGIGKTIALAFAEEGVNLVVASRTHSEIEGTAREIESMGRKALAVKADVSNREDVKKMVDATLKEFGRVDVLVNNAGILGPIGPVVDNDIEDWVKAIHINLIGAFLCSRAVLPTMMEQRWGRIINLSGGGAAYGRPFFSAYASSKAALVRFTECLAEEVREYGILVNAIAPGAVNTRMQEETLAAGAKAGKKALTQAREVKESGGVSPRHAASLALFLASDGCWLSGRLISAVWDDWQNITEERMKEIMSNELYTLRRIDEVFFYPGRKR